MRNFFTSTTCLAVLCAAPIAAYAADASEDASVEDVVVTATRSGDAIPVDLIGGSVTVLDSQALTDRQTRVVSDVLRDVPGAAVSRTGAIGGFPLKGPGRAFCQLPFKAKQIVEKVIAPLGRCSGPGTF